MTIDTSGPAFPTIGNIGYNSDWQSDDGMSLRDWFAATAPVDLRGALLACGFTDSQIGLMSGENRAVVFAVMSVMRYEYADAMLSARKGGA